MSRATRCAMHSERLTPIGCIMYYYIPRRVAVNSPGLVYIMRLSDQHDGRTMTRYIQKYTHLDLLL